ncbi:protein rep [Sulfobacillus thermosulfidooxidans]|uniref:protein rep n=1 Tax=Sulfobacillus thermosulfidooxidans TaxID=28034 RepID=UPI0003073EF7|nr:protein rep [Sulfobacillus thermosulfidooxidans]
MATAWLDTKGINSRKTRKNKLERDMWMKEHISRNQRLSKDLMAVKGHPNLTEEDLFVVHRIGKTIGSCSSNQWLAISQDGTYQIQDTLSCHTRFCGICAAYKTRQFRHKQRQWIVGDRTVLDGRGKLAGNRSDDEIGRWMVAQIELKSAQNRLPSSQDGLTKLLNQVLESGELERQKIEKKLNWYFITLTIPNIPHIWERQNGKDILDNAILKPWRKLWATSRKKFQYTDHRRTGRKAIPGMRIWRNIRGYFGRLEITWNQRSKTFHPHLHLLVFTEAAWLPKDLVRATWQHYVSKRAQIIDVRRANPTTIPNELVKYVTKTIDVQDAPEALAEIVRALYRRRTILTGGAAYGVRWSKEQEDDEKERQFSEAWGEAKEGKPPIRGLWVRRVWDDEKQTWRYTVVGHGDIMQPRARLRKLTADGELLTPYYRDTWAFRYNVRKTRTFKPSDDPRTWRKLLEREAKEKMRKYWKQNPVNWLWEWLFTGLLSIVAAPKEGWRSA